MKKILTLFILVSAISFSYQAGAQSWDFSTPSYQAKVPQGSFAIPNWKDYAIPTWKDFYRDTFNDYFDLPKYNDNQPAGRGIPGEMGQPVDPQWPIRDIPDIDLPSPNEFRPPIQVGRFDAAYDVRLRRVLVVTEKAEPVEDGMRSVIVGRLYDEEGRFINDGEVFDPVVGEREVQLSPGHSLMDTDAGVITDFFPFLEDAPADEQPECYSYQNPTVAYALVENVFYVSWEATCKTIVRQPAKRGFLSWDSEAKQFDAEGLYVNECEADNITPDCTIIKVPLHFNIIQSVKLSPHNLRPVVEGNLNQVWMTSRHAAWPLATDQEQAYKKIWKWSSATEPHLAVNDQGKVLLTYQSNIKGSRCLDAAGLNALGGQNFNDQELVAALEQININYARFDVVSSIEGILLSGELSDNRTLFRDLITVSDDQDGQRHADVCTDLHDANNLVNAYNPSSVGNADGFTVVYSLEDGTLDEMQDEVGRNKRIASQVVRVEEDDLVGFVDDQETIVVTLRNSDEDDLPENSVRAERDVHGNVISRATHSEPVLSYDDTLNLFVGAFDDSEGSYVFFLNERSEILSAGNDDEAMVYVRGQHFEDAAGNQTTLIEDFIAGYNPRLSLLQNQQLVGYDGQVIGSKWAVTYNYRIDNDWLIGQNFIQVHQTGDDSWEVSLEYPQDEPVSPTDAFPDVNQNTNAIPQVFALRPAESRFLTFWVGSDDEELEDPILNSFISEGRDQPLECNDEQLGQPCSVGIGACAAEGVYVCEDGQLVCEGEPNPLAADVEICDGIDNDCDGNTDENEDGGPLVQACYTGADGSENVGECRGGIQICHEGDYGECQNQIVPVDETCDGLDNDCDGVNDNGFADIGVGDECSAGEGQCRNTGLKICNAAGEVVCNVEAGSPDNQEICDGFDNDCDGDVDEGFDDLGDACVLGLGACRADGVKVCRADGLGTICNAVPGIPANDDSVCDDVDNDCDGNTDEDFISRPTQCGQSICAAEGETQCVEGDVVDTCEPIDPLAENDITCDGVDDDCDGNVDDDYEVLETECGVGACAATGVTSCVEGNEQDSCAPLERQVEDDASCDGEDNNCNGEIDEDYVAQNTACGVGVCAAQGVTSCVEGEEQDSCVPLARQVEDDTSCDGEDNNCNGEVDEDYAPQNTACGMGVCAAVGVTSCVAGEERDSCTPLEIQAEVDNDCDNEDDNCNGLIDEAYIPIATICGVGACAAEGITSCVAGEVQDSCEPGERLAENDATCDGVDDNCNDQTDEDAPDIAAENVFGACVNNLQTCQGGGYVAHADNYVPVDEICDGEDNNCNDTVDEGFDEDADAIADCFDECLNNPHNDANEDNVCDVVFEDLIQLGAGDVPGAIDAGDFDGDDDIDVVVANRDSDTVSVFLWDEENSQFADSVAYGVGTQPFDVKVAHLNEDDILDLAITNLGSANVSVLNGNGNGTFPDGGISLATGGQPIRLDVGDITDDGFNDLVVANFGSTYFSSFVWDDDNDEFLDRIDTIAPARQFDVKIGNLDNNQSIDIVASSIVTPDLWLYDGNGAGGFPLRSDYDVVGLPGPIEIVDLDGDGHQDILLSNYTNDTEVRVDNDPLANSNFSVLLWNDELADYEAPVNYVIADTGFGLHVADINNDNHLDVIISHVALNQLTILFGNGNGTFVDPIVYNDIPSPSETVAQDFNGDGKVDLAIASADDPGALIILFQD